MCQVPQLVFQAMAFCPQGVKTNQARSLIRAGHRAVVFRSYDENAISVFNFTIEAIARIRGNVIPPDPRCISAIMKPLQLNFHALGAELLSRSRERAVDRS